MRTPSTSPVPQRGAGLLILGAAVILGWGLLLQAVPLAAHSSETGAPWAAAPPRAGAPPTTPAFATPTVVVSVPPTRSPTPRALPSATTTLLPGAPTPAWRRVRSPDSGPLGSLAGVQPADLWTMGQDSLHWDGAAWQVVPVPSPMHGSLLLGKMSAGAGDSVWAGGGGPINGGAWVAAWDGQQWRRIYPGPAATGPALPTGPELHDVRAYSPDAALALYTDYNYGEAHLGLLDCTATACAAGAAYGGPGEVRVGWGVAGFSASDAWVVGEQGNLYPGTPIPATLILHWDGQQWTVPAYPDIGTLSGISGAAPNDVWAAGAGGFLHWNGQTWSQVPSPAGASRVSARSSDDAWAVGAAGFLHWDGQTWRQVPGAQAALADVLVLAADNAWAVGADAQNHSLIEQYTSLPAFSDVTVTAPFYPYIAWMSDRGDISGYSCGEAAEPCDVYARPYFRPGAPVTRAQLLKMVVAAAGWALLTPPTPSFADVPASSPFYAVIETGAAQGIISGYACGGPGEPCDGGQRPYFRPYANITRGQLAKVISLARGYPLPAPTPPTFADVPPSQPFAGYIAAVAAQGVVSGYSCGGPGEPCPGVYFRPGNNATRSQVAKFVTLAYLESRPRAP